MKHLKCEHCGNSYHWSEAFAKFGYDDGDGKVKTPLIAHALEDAGYRVKYSRWSPHNTIIYSIKKGGVEFTPCDNPNYRIGYDDPSSYLPIEIVSLLDDTFTQARVFR